MKARSTSTASAHGKEAAGIVHGPRLRNIGQSLAGGLRGVRAEAAEQDDVEQPDDARNHGNHSSTALKSRSSALSSRTTPAMISTGSA